MYFLPKDIRNSNLGSFSIRREFTTSFKKQQSSASPVGPVSSIHHNGICPDVRPLGPWGLGTPETIAVFTLEYTHGWYLRDLAVVACPFFLNQCHLSIHDIIDYPSPTMLNVGMYIT